MLWTMEAGCTASRGTDEDHDRAGRAFSIVRRANPLGAQSGRDANKIHYDGATDEEVVIQVWGMGRATATPAEKK